MKHLLFQLFATAVAIAPAAAASKPDEKPVSIVLVHGAFVDASGWQSVYNILSKRGYEVLVVQNPTITLAGDVTATKEVIAKAKHPVVLVGHSYGGAVITELGNDAKVKSLVYFAAFAPEPGETVFELATRPTPGEEGPPLLPPQDGFILVDAQKFPNAFAAGIDPAVTNFMAAAQVPWGLGAVKAKLTEAAWKTKPTYFMVTKQDHMVPPSIQRFMATRASAKTVEIDSSHAVMLTHPGKVADFIVEAASAVK